MSIGRNNTSGVCGVSLDKRTGKWIAQIMVDYKYIYLGKFNGKNDAILARKKAEIKYDFHPNHGENIQHELDQDDGYQKWLDNVQRSDLDQFIQEHEHD